jgi:CheY-like chemotaxis protein
MTMVSAMQSALRARRRQYEVRDLLQQLEDGVRQRDEFLAMLGHELRNPLAAISGASYVLDQMVPADEQAQMVRSIIDRQTKHLSRLVDDLLDVSRVTKGKITLQRQPIDLNEMARRCCQAIEAAAKARHHRLELKLEPRPLMVDGDPARLEQVVSNLLTNAVKYTPTNGVIDVSTRREGSEVVLSVRDNGIGIAPELLPQVFDLFSQAQGTLDRSQGGLGIGLTVVRGLVEMHGGEVVAHSDGLDKGSVFSVRLPLIEAAPEHASGQEEPCIEAVNDRQRVLVVEDNADAREVMCFLLQQWGYEVETAEDGPDGIEKAVEVRPVVAIIDIGLPQLNGYEVARRIRERIDGHIYLIALTGYGQPDDQARALEAGFDVHMVKPIEPGRLSQLLANLSEPAATSRAT